MVILLFFATVCVCVSKFFLEDAVIKNGLVISSTFFYILPTL